MFAPLQLCPHAPQELRFEARLVSQPSSATGAAGFKQFPQPSSQVDAHVPPAQTGVVAWAVEHARPQAPQWSGEIRRSDSQPSSGPVAGREQFAKFARQALVQSPSLQVSASVPALEQARPQAPQLAVLVFRLVSQPLLSSPSQSAKPGVQLSMRH